MVTTKQLTTLAVASRIASRPTSSSGLLSILSRAAIGNFCSHMYRRRTYHLLLYTNIWCALLSHKSLKNVNPNPIDNPNPKPKPKP